MEKAGLIEVSLGRNAKGVQFEGMTTTSYHPSLATRFKPTMVLIGLAEEAAIVEEGANEHFLHLRLKFHNLQGHTQKLYRGFLM
jgi:hypothetical protein